MHNKPPIHLSQNLSIKMLAEINKIPEHIKQDHKKRSIRLATLRQDVKNWFKAHRAPIDTQQEA